MLQRKVSAQTYILRELRAFYSSIEDDDDLKRQVATLEEAFRRPITAAVKRQINVLRRNGITGKHLLTTLSDTYHEYGMSDHVYTSRQQAEQEIEELPRIVCSEAFI